MGADAAVKSSLWDEYVSQMVMEGERKECIYVRREARRTGNATSAISIYTSSEQSTFCSQQSRRKGNAVLGSPISGYQVARVSWAVT